MHPHSCRLPTSPLLSSPLPNFSLHPSLLQPPDLSLESGPSPEPCSWQDVFNTDPLVLTCPILACFSGFCLKSHLAKPVLTAPSPSLVRVLLDPCLRACSSPPHHHSTFRQGHNCPLQDGPLTPDWARQRAGILPGDLLSPVPPSEPGLKEGHPQNSPLENTPPGL